MLENEYNDTKKQDIKPTKARWVEFLQKKCNGGGFYGRYISGMDSQVISEEDICTAIGGRSGRGNWKWNNSNTPSDTTNKILYKKILQTETISKRQKLDERIYYIISVWPLLAKEKYINIYNRVCVINCTLT